MLVLASLLAAELGGTAPPPLPIYGGTVVPPGELTEVVSIDGRCTGVLVGPKLVLYAAHCGDGPAYISIDERAYRVAWCRSLDERMDARAAGQGQDFAACELEASPPVVPAVLARRDSNPPVDLGDAVLIAGFGADEFGQRGTKRSANSHVFDVTDDYFGVGGDGVDSCLGDSGGPAFVDFDGERRVAGILSYGYACGDGGYYGHAARVESWLTQTFGEEALARGADSGGCSVAEPGRTGWLFWLVGSALVLSGRDASRRSSILGRVLGRVL